MVAGYLSGDLAGQLGGRLSDRADVPLLDRLTGVTALEAFSLYRKLRSSYTGAAFNIRRSSGGVLDVGFRGNYVDIAAALAFCAGVDGFIVTPYDQGTAARNVTQATDARQPKLITAGVLSTIGTGKPAGVFDGLDDRWVRADACGLSGSPAVTIFAAGTMTLAANQTPWGIGGTAINKDTFGLFWDGASMAIDYGSAGVVFTPTPAITTPCFWVHQHAAGGAVTTGTLEQNGVLLSQTSTIGAGALALTNTATVIGATTAQTFFKAMALNVWGVLDNTVSGFNLAALRAELAAHVL